MEDLTDCLSFADPLVPGIFMEYCKKKFGQDYVNRPPAAHERGLIKDLTLDNCITKYWSIVDSIDTVRTLSTTQKSDLIERRNTDKKYELWELI